MMAPRAPSPRDAGCASPVRAAVLRVTAGDSVTTARRRLGQAFRRAGLDSPELDARILAAHALRLESASLFAAAERLLSADEAETVTALAQRRLAREPVARITGRKEFWGLSFNLTPATLVPRPDSETVVQTALEAVHTAGPRQRPLTIADLGTGSGALLIALLSEFPRAWGVGTDLSLEALAAARDNAVRLGFGGRATFLAAGLGAALCRQFDLVVCNPPYIPSGEIVGLDPEVRDHDPRLALDGGPDGLAAYRSLAVHAARLLAPHGHLVVEIGAGAAESVTVLFSGAGLRLVATRTDLAGVVRALCFTRTEWV